MKKIVLLIFAVLFASISLFAQERQITGTVTDEDGSPAVGVAVIVKGTGVVATTDGNGRFSVEAPAGSTLQFTSVGFTTEERYVAAGMSNVSVRMTSKANVIDDVVVVAYGTQSARSTTSSIASVKAETIKDSPSVSVDQMLQGRAAGVSVTTPSAAVGQVPIIRVRGVSTINSGNQPLYVVDGMPITSGNISEMGNSNALADINPSDIVSIDILKDAAATSMYGSRAANGVVLITTKKGTRGRARVTYDMNYGFTEKTKFTKVMNAQEYMDFKNMAVSNSATYSASYPDGMFFPMYDSNGNMRTTKWEDEVFHKGVSQSHTVAVSGGTDRSQFYMSANFTENEGIVIGDYYKRLGVNGSASHKATEWLKLGLTVNYTNSRTSFTDAARNGSTFASSGFPRAALVLPPNMPAWNEDGTPYYEYGSYFGYGNNKVLTTLTNPVAMSYYGNGIDSYVDRGIATGFAEITPIKGLTYKTQYGIDYAVIEDERFWNPFHGDGYTNGGLSNSYTARRKTWTWTNTLNYKITICNDHNIDLLAGMESSEERYKLWSVQRSGLTDTGFTGLLGDYTTYSGGSRAYTRTMISYFGRINYDYKSKYMFSANIRRDGYSPLGVNNRWGNFGGVSAAWRVSDEEFFSGAKNVVNDLKIKASWGLVGNADIGYYPAQSTYTSGYYGDNGTFYTYNIGDENLKWESTNTYDIGFSAALFNSRMMIDFDYYYSKSSDLILDVPQSLSTGIGTGSPLTPALTTNMGKMANQGVELTISGDIIRSQNFTWNSSFNITVNKNRVKSLAENITAGDYSSSGTTSEITNITTEGRSIGQLYLFPTGGIDPSTGRRIFYGPNGEKTFFTYESGTPIWYLADGSVFNSSNFERKIMGNTLPTWYGGWNNTFTYKGFDLNLFIQFSGGNKIYNGTRATSSDMRFWNNSRDVLKKHWTPTRTNAKYAKPVFGDNYSNGSAMPISDWIEKGDFVRMKNISLGYTFDTKKTWAEKIGISSLRLFVQVQNLFVLTKYKGIDPEVLSNNYTATRATLGGGIDKNTLPQARTYTFGLNVAF